MPSIHSANAPSFASGAARTPPVSSTACGPWAIGRTRCRPGCCRPAARAPMSCRRRQAPEHDGRQRRVGASSNAMNRRVRRGPAPRRGRSRSCRSRTARGSGPRLRVCVLRRRARPCRPPPLRPTVVDFRAADAETSRSPPSVWLADQAGARRIRSHPRRSGRGRSAGRTPRSVSVLVLRLATPRRSGRGRTPRPPRPLLVRRIRIEATPRSAAIRARGTAGRRAAVAAV